jgi:6-pyruvoyl-tetrahydropterin synthase
VTEFAEGKLIPTTENIVLWIWERMAPNVPGRVRLVLLGLKEVETMSEDRRGATQGARGWGVRRG